MRGTRIVRPHFSERDGDAIVVALERGVAPKSLILVVDGTWFDYGFHAAVLAANVRRRTVVPDREAHRDLDGITRLEERLFTVRMHYIWEWSSCAYKPF